jgi:repressor LexA
VGEVAAGPPILAQENIVGEILVEGSILRGGRHFALEVRGDSMTCAGIDDSDLVIVRQQALADSGDIVVALIDDEATVKRLWMREGMIELRPENPRYDPIVVSPESDLRIVGKVVAVRSKGVGSE